MTSTSSAVRISVPVNHDATVGYLEAFSERDIDALITLTVLQKYEQAATFRREGFTGIR